MGDIILKKVNKIKLKAAMKTLSSEEQELISDIYFKRYSLKKYAGLKNIPYTTAVSPKQIIMKKLRKC